MKLVVLGFVLGLSIGWMMLDRTSPIAALLSKSAPFTIPVPRRDRKERILCWVPVWDTSSERIQIIRKAHGAYCDDLVFIARDGLGDKDPRIWGHKYDRVDNRDLWNQISRGWLLVSERLLDKFEWFIKLDEDSLFVPQNFVSMIIQNKWTHQQLVYFGSRIFEQSRPIHQFRAQFNLGAGYGVSQQLLREMTPYFMNNSHSSVPVSNRCPEWLRWNEDVKFADCIRIVHPSFVPNRTTDSYRRDHFLPFEPHMHLKMSFGEFVPWFWRGKSRHEHEGDIQCCSSRPVVFHHIKDVMLLHRINYFLFDVMVDPIPQTNMRPVFI